MQPDFRSTRRRLTRRYWLFSTSLLLVFGSTIYLQVADSRRQLLKEQLSQLACAAESQLPLLRRQLPPQPAAAGLLPVSPATGLPATELPATDLEEAREMGLDSKRIRWFDPQLHLLAEQGLLPLPGGTIPPQAKRDRVSQFPVAGGLAIWYPVHGPRRPGSPAALEGYVSVVLSSASAAHELERLRNGMVMGCLIALLVSILISEWMVTISIRPVRDQVERLIRFTADASHELRQPLTGILALIGSLREAGLLEKASPQLREKVQLIERTTDRMAHLVDDLLLLARLDQRINDHSGWRTFPLDDLLEDLLGLHQGAASQRGLTLQGRIQSSVPVRGQPERLQELLSNLLGNAIRFSPPGGVITVRLETLGRTAVVTVDDQGPGVPAELRERVFERFWQADPARSEPSSSGLGLSIALSVALAHGGRLEAREAPGGGCRMWLQLPLQEAPVLTSSSRVQGYGPGR